MGARRWPWPLLALAVPARGAAPSLGTGDLDVAFYDGADDLVRRAGLLPAVVLNPAARHADSW